MVLLGLRLVKDLDEAAIVLRKPILNTATELRSGARGIVHADQLGTKEFNWRERAGGPRSLNADNTGRPNVGTATSPAGTKPEHIKGKLDDWVYGRSRPNFPAKTKNDVNLTAAQRADGKLICSTSGQTLEVQRMTNGEPQFFKYNEKGHAKRTQPPDYYNEWKAQNTISPTDPPIVNNNVEFTKPAPRVADMGHVEDAEYWRLQQFAIYHKIDEAGFKEVYSNASHYRLEEQSANRGHSHESTEPGYGHYAELADKYSQLPNAPDPETIVKGLPKPGSGGSASTAAPSAEV
ncbi:GH-E family nuclease [Nocardia sp. CA-120079]|uniref:GH-E family nuclease n=1 Tax=Nocardia sp. CA-120079 TaxID=3239974 RepID=UPI003D95985E